MKLKKTISFVLALCLIMSTLTLSASAKVFSSSGNLRGKNYTRSWGGEVSNFTCSGTSSDAKSTLINYAAGSRYVAVSVKRYNYNNMRWDNIDSTVRSAKAGEVITRRISRSRNSYVYNYSHTGAAYISNTINSPVRDSYSYTARQYY